MSIDELTAALSSNVQVTSNHDYNPSTPHPRFSQYKAKFSASSQAERRAGQLARQKDKRKDYANLVRRLTVGFDDGEELSDEDDDVDLMETDQQLKRKEKFYAKQLMLSEWLVDVPTDFKSEWLAVPCPVGRRCLVVTDKGKTTAYNKGGHYLHGFHSNLPCGNRIHGYRGTQNTILDCVYCDIQKTYYILDVMCWNGHPVYDSDTEFRTFWLTSQLVEMEHSVQEVSEHNPYKFEMLPRYACDISSLEHMMAKPLKIQLDGLLFYHKQAHYTLGPTPLVLWLKAYMLPEILEVAVPESFLKQAPSSYTGFQNHADVVRDDRQWTEEKERWKQRSAEKKQKENSAKVEKVIVID